MLLALLQRNRIAEAAMAAAANGLRTGALETTTSNTRTQENIRIEVTALLQSYGDNVNNRANGDAEKVEILAAQLDALKEQVEILLTRSSSVSSASVFATPALLLRDSESINGIVERSDVVDDSVDAADYERTDVWLEEAST